jgi:hypothetical protein
MKASSPSGINGAEAIEGDGHRGGADVIALHGTAARNEQLHARIDKKRGLVAC